MGTEEQSENGGGVATASDTLSITDNRTGKTYEVPVEDGTIRTMALRDIKVSEDDFGLMGYDPAFLNTASTRSEIGYIDGDAGILEYRGYPIDQLCEKSTYLEVAYLLVHGELPTQAQLDTWVHEITMHTFVHENVKKFVEGFRYDAHPMGMLLASSVRSRRSTRRARGQGRGDPLLPRDPADREDADARRLRLPAQHGPAVHLSGQRPDYPATSSR
jgi:citrate synthase